MSLLPSVRQRVILQVSWKEKATEFRINVTALPKKVTAQLGKKKVQLAKVTLER